MAEQHLIERLRSFGNRTHEPSLRQLALEAASEIDYLTMRVQEMNHLLGWIRRNATLSDRVYTEIDKVMIQEER